MPLVTASDYAHVRLTVTDVERSKAFYDQLFGWPVAIDAREHLGEDGVADDPDRFYGGVVYQMPGGTLFGLRPVGGDGFDGALPTVVESADAGRVWVGGDRQGGEELAVL